MKFKKYITESTPTDDIFFVERWENKKGDSVHVTKLMFGKGYSLEINGQYDKNFKTEQQYKSWLKKGKYELVGFDKQY